MRLGEIQGVEIYEEDLSIWFVKERVGHVIYLELEKRNFEIADFLIEEGYKIENSKGFDLELKSLLLKS